MRLDKPEIKPHRIKPRQRLAQVFSGHDALRRKPQGAETRNGLVRLTEQEIMQTSLDAFMELVREDGALQKIKAVLG